ncbi:T9SS type B sorting domain-containing protein [Flavobacterium soli]|uniref:T9SS type B sorting domain-containing protein n=1 Tax=Flavobacterium soli TaxID=344881 RepID=UPI00047D27F9|nr:T9SS type B sorting domain-containing protein [Flavobacterium soli]
MTKIVSTPLLLLLFFVSSQSVFSQCFQIESILVAACSPTPNTEGYNEMVRFQVGPNPLNTSNLVVDWPSNGWEGLVQNPITASQVATLNADIDAVGGCGNLLEPIGGVLPANASVILVTSYLMDTDSNSFGALAEDTYIIFQNNLSNTAGHFANYNVNPGLRTLEITFTGAGGCTDTVTYDRTLLTGSIGDTVLFTPSGTASYDNFGCSAPIPPFTVDAGIPSTSPACAGTTISLLGTVEGQQSLLWTAPTGTLSDPTIIGTNYTIPGDAAGQSITITLTATNSCGASITDTLIVNVTSSTVPTFNLPTTLCTGATAPALPTTSLNGITGTWSPSAINNTADGSYVFTPTAGQCSNSFTLNVTVSSGVTPVVEFSYPTPVCATLTSLMPILDPGFTTGGTFTSDTGLTINPSTGEINVSTSTPGAHSIIYTVVANPAACLEAGSDFFTIQITSSIQPIVGFSYPVEVCSSNPPVSPTTDPGFVTGGTFTSDAGLTIDPATGTIDVVSSAIGSHEITYTLPEDPTICQEEGIDTFTILITNAITPVLNFSYTTPVCTSSTPIMPTTATGFATGGTFGSTTGLNIDPATGEIDVAGSTPGSYTVTYILAPDPATCNPGGNFPANITINDLAPAVVNFSYTTPVCPNDPPVNPILPTGFTSGGTFTSDAGLSINPSTGQINVVASTLGMHVITYTVLQNDTTCTTGDSDTFNFTIDATAAITPITGPTSLCVGETIQLSNATPGGTWSSSDESVATVDNNGLVTALFSNFVDIIYTLNNGCASDTRTTITVYEIPQPVLQDRYLCISNVTGNPFNSVRIECGIPNQGYTFTWTLDGNPLPTTTNTHVATELGVYEVTVTNDVSGCSNTASCTVLPSSTAVATATVGEDFNQNQTITVDVTGGSGDYLFQLDYGVPQESNVFTYAHQGEYTITVIDQNGCQDLVLTIFAINYPRYFTPNGDGFNDFWKIEGITDLNAKTHIFDRFGKLVKSLNASGEGWDGTLNGEQLPSTDYWFQLLYENRDGVNKEFKAHFSMKR